MLRSTWRGLETWHGRDGVTLADERARQQGTRTSTYTGAPVLDPTVRRTEASLSIGASSDPTAGKPTNKAEQSVAEPVEPRAEAQGNASQQSTGRTQSWGTVSQAQERIRQRARQRKKERFTSLLHHISIDQLDEAFYELKEDAALGVDGLTWTDYELNLERRLEDLHAQVQRGAHRALPSQRRYIPKPDGRQRPLAVAALEDKIVQRATAAVLNGIYEEDFLGFCVLQKHMESSLVELTTVCCKAA